MAILDTQNQVVEIECPHCQEKSNHEVKITIYEPNIDIDLNI